MTVAPIGELAVARAQRRRRARGVDPVLAVAAAVCVALVVLAVAGPALAPYAPDATSLLDANAGVSSAHPLGTDSLGRDNLSRVLHGARLSLVGPLAVVAIAGTLGTALAIASAWLGGTFDRVAGRVVDVLFAFPAILFALLAVAVFGRGLLAPVIALAIAYTPYVARVVRTVAVRERRRDYVDACRLAGLSGWRICLRHLLPNVSGYVLAQSTILSGSALIDLAGISFLGLGVQPPDSEWGLIVAGGRAALLNGQPQAALSAGVMIVVAVVALNVLGERLAARQRGPR